MELRNLRQLGLCLLAALALSAAMAPAASAANDKFYSSWEPTVITAHNEADFNLTLNASKFKFKCKEATLAGTFFEKVATEITTYPTFDQCDGRPFEPNECVIRLTGTTVEEKDPPIEIGCPALKAMYFIHEMCNIRIEPQTVRGVTYTNTEENLEGKQWKTMTMKMTITELEYEKQANVPLGCLGLGGSGVAKDGTITGSYTVTAFKDASEGVENGDEFKENGSVHIEVKESEK
ncbi:MAG: hypothetical protein WA687_06905 [Solirubrobacterales bacterium]